MMEPSPTRPPPTSWAVAAPAVAVVAVVAQLPWALPGAFLWDDLPLLVSSDLYTSPDQWGHATSAPLGLETWYWRPLATTSFLLESLLHGGSASGFRVTAALLHAVTAGLATVLFARLLRSRGAALVAGLVFAIHPVNVEAVTWISARFDLLAALFAVGALLCVRPDGHAGTRARRVALGVCTGAAMLSKENAVVIPMLVALWGLVLAPAPGSVVAALRDRWRTWGAAILGLVVVLVTRLERLGFLFGVNPNSAEEAGGPLSHVLLVGRAVASYAEAFFAPWSGVGPAHHGVRPVPASDPQGWLGLAILAAIVIGCVAAWRRGSRTAPLLSALLVSLAPVLQIVPLDLAGGLHAADRYMYLPSFFAVALVADAVTRVAFAEPASQRRRSGLVTAAGIVIVALGAGRLAVLPNWTSPARFWSWAERQAPDSSVTLSNRVEALLGSAWMGREDVSAAEEAALRLHRLDAEFGSAALLVRVLLAQGRHERSEALAGQAVQFHARNAEYRVLRGRARLFGGDLARARTDFQRALELTQEPGGDRSASLRPEALAGVAEVLAIEGQDRVLAAQWADRAEAELANGGPSAVVQLARVRLTLADSEGALRAIGNGSRIPPHRLPELFELAATFELPAVTEVLRARAGRAGMPDAATWSATGVGHEAAGRWDRAEAAHRRATELAPESPRGWDDLGYALFETGDEEGSERALRRSVEADQEFAPARLHLGVLLRKTGREEAGVAELEIALRLATDSGHHELEALISRQLARPAEAPVEDAGDDGR